MVFRKSCSYTNKIRQSKLVALKLKEEKQSIKQNINIKFGRILQDCLKTSKIGAEQKNTACIMLGTEQKLVNKDESC